MSNERIRRFPLYNWLVGSHVATRLRRALAPKFLRDAVKSKLTMQYRPVLSDETRLSIEEVFNQDLACLGDHLGIALNCSNFKEVTSEKSLNWVKVDGQ